MKNKVLISYQEIISVDNLLEAWKEFICGKSSKKDVQEFNLHLMDNVLSLHVDLKSNRYQHGGYEAFNISDPKPRNIHKASVRDRLLHHAIYRKLYPLFDKTFIADSFSCRDDKGTHKAGKQFRAFFNSVSKNNTQTAWVLKCDIRKFFASIDQKILLDILKEYIPDQNILLLLGMVISSFETTPGVGLPLGNLTSQLLVNIYLNKLDQFVKHALKARYYIRYADDFLFLSTEKSELDLYLYKLQPFLENTLHLRLHPKKVKIQTFSSGVDFLGWVHFQNHQVLRTTTKRRMLKKLQTTESERTISSYLGLLSHGNGYKLQKKVIAIDTKNPTAIFNA